MQDNPLRRWLNHLIKKKGQAVLVKALGKRDRRRVLRHFLALDRDDRLLRFGSVLPDAQVEAYVAKLDFSKDIVFGVYNGRFQLVGVGHLAFTSREAHPDSIHYTDKEKVAEFGVSVATSARGKGFGGRLFERAALHARNRGIDTLFIHALSENAPMLKIARNAGATVERDGGESEAWLRLPPDSVSSHVDEALERHMAEWDFQFKRHMRTVGQFLDGVAEVKSRLRKVRDRAGGDDPKR